MEEKFKQLVVAANKIVVTAHIAPDPDAVASSLLLTETLKTNFPEKQTELVLEERPAENLNFLYGFNDMRNMPLADALKEIKPDLVIITDTDNFDRVSRSRANDIRDYLKSNNVPVAVIDHHERDERDTLAVIINRHAAAAAEEVYHLCFDVYGWKKPEGYAETTLLGIVMDTVRFRYENPLHRETFAIVNDLLDAGADIQRLQDKIDRYTDDQMAIMTQLAVNMKAEGDHTYSYIEDDFFKQYMAAGKSYADFKAIIGMYNDEFIRKVADRRWGYIVYQDPSLPNTYKVSFRAITGAKDVRAIALILKGGGHVPAAAATLKATNISAALAQVRDAIKQVQ
jgi:phosphoesterase RecJ-like protein